MDTVPSYTQLAQGYTPSLSQTSTPKKPEVQRKQPQKSTPTTDTFNVTEEARKPTPQTKPKKEAPPWAMIIGGTVALGTLIGLGIWQRESISQWFKPEKAIAEVAEKTKQSVNRSTIEKSPELIAQLEKMHAVFDDPAPNGYPWYRLKVNVLGESTETEAKTYLEGVKLVKDAKHLYLGDLHGSWLKGLLQLAQMEAIVMPENTAKEFLAIHKAFELLEKKDNQLVINHINTNAECLTFLDDAKNKHLAKIIEEIAKGEMTLDVNKGYTAESIAKSRTNNVDFARLIKMFEFTNPQTKEEVHILVKRFKEALKTITVVDPAKELNLVGDVLGDRGQLDLFTLLLVEKLKTNINIVNSNHDFITFDLLIKYLSGEDARYYNYTNHLAYFDTGYFGQSQSSGRLLVDANEGIQKLLSTKGVKNLSFTKEEVIQLYKDYFSRLKLVHYDPDDKSIMFHCLVREAPWQALATFLNPTSPLIKQETRANLTPEQLRKEVEALNSQFQQKLAKELNSGTSASADYSELLKLLNDDIWFSDNDGRAGRFDYQQFPSFGNNVNCAIVGHDDYNGRNFVEAHARMFHQLDNSALKHEISGKESPVVITK
ncbi:MAG: hypothetical protein NTW61_01385 [Candidatus Melainabacteria bacterium]|nr:hypothetical protein [Candidatus Melainabacteria bacterium]